MDLFGRKAKEKLEALDDIRSGDFDRQIRSYTQKLALDYGDRVLNYCDRATAYRNKGEFDMALADLNEAIRLAPKDSHPYSERAYTYYFRGLADGSWPTNYGPSVDIYVRFSKALDSREGCLSYAAIRDFDHAVADFETALKLWPDNESAKRGLARLERQGQQDASS